jgi:hypothetical protein
LVVAGFLDRSCVHGHQEGMNARARVLFQFMIDAELRRQLRHFALDCDLSAAELVRRAVLEFLERRSVVPPRPESRQRIAHATPFLTPREEGAP